MPTTLTQITCPTCDTCYGVDAVTFPPEGRAVRCARCQEVWTAYAETATFDADIEGAAATDSDAVAPAIDSPSTADGNPQGWDIDASDRPAPDGAVADTAFDGGPAAQGRLSWVSRILAYLPSPKDWFRRPPAKRATASPLLRLSRRGAPKSHKLPALIAGLGAVVAGLVIWRAELVRLLPQTAIAFRVIGLPVNLRGIAFQDMKIRTESVDGAPVLVIEGALVGTTKKPVEIPRLRFIVRDSKGTEIYAWNAVLEQAVLKNGDAVAFRSRLASPPAEARDIEVRFFHRRDLARGAV